MKRNYEIDWEKLTEIDAENIICGIGGKFNLVAKSLNDKLFHDISYVFAMGLYDDNMHSHEIHDIIGSRIYSEFHLEDNTNETN